jgi:hypothetical protein
MTRIAIVVVAVMNLLIVSVAGAQLLRRPRLIEVGDRVRIGIREDTSRSTFLAGQQIHGIVHAIAPETLYLELPRPIGTVPIPRAAIQGVYVSTGTPSRAASALDFGSAGALLGGLFLPSFIPHAQQRFGSPARAVAASTGIGFGVSALIGALFPYEHWRVAWIPE